ncbi:hypothetical protein [Dulcicalothrix desertica]|uniref:hypothetical protein n=1 Tax=Dulcicalothrix desertica TaxID=32056 RepID=UPI00119AF7AF|nr:hypothetical protein [Dulcicalothrix desertica]TWH44158.1 hypothetical protein CAL7102_07940 [Dulcicalothrix desertica PCC 7102]
MRLVALDATEVSALVEAKTQGNVTDTAINTGVVGNRNNTRINNVTNVSQAQSAACY